jgi:hypothetical protein
MNGLLRTSRLLPPLVAALAWTAIAAAQSQTAAAPADGALATAAQENAEATYIVQGASLDSARTHVRRVGAEPERDL